MTALPQDEQMLALARAEIEHWRQRLRAESADIRPAVMPETGSDALVSLALRVGQIGSTGMFAAAEGDIYAARAMSRIASEHWVRALTLLDDIRASGDAPAGAHFWQDLRRAEAVVAHCLVLDWFQLGLSSPGLPDFVREQLRPLILNPAPDAAEAKSARATIGRYSFKRGLDRLWKALDDKTHDDDNSFGSLALTYPTLSGCIHAGPEAHSLLLLRDSIARVTAALDLAIPWVLTLVFLRTYLAGGDRAAPAVTKARLLQSEIEQWHAVAEMRARVATLLATRA
jgi:hypothetical protein